MFTRRKKKNKFEKESLQLRKTLSLSLPFFTLKNLNITNHILRNTFKYSFAKKIKTMTFESDVFPYYAHHIPKSLRQITLKRLRFSSTTSSFKFNKNLAIRSLESQKHLKRLEINEGALLGQIKAVRKMPNLEHLSFTLFEGDIPSLYNLFREAGGLNHLQTVQLMIRKDNSKEWVWTPQQIDKIWMFLKDLVNLKHLNTLRLNIHDCFFTEDPRFFYRLLGMMGERSNIKTLDLILHLINYEEDELNEGANKILNQVQALDVKSHQHHVIYVDFDEINVTEKKIKISFLPNCRQEDIPLSKLITKCSALKTLVIDDHLGKLIVSADSQELAAKLETLKVTISHKDDQKTLELLRFISNSSLSHLLDFSMGLYHFTDETLKEVTRINSSFSPSQIQKYSIFTQDVYHCHPDFDETQRANFFSKLPKSELFSMLFESISRFTSLTNLDIFTRLEDLSTIESLAKTVEHLENLEDLKIQVYGKERIPQGDVIRIDLPVYNLLKLRSFSLKLSFNFRLRDFLGFLEKMAEIKELGFFVLDCVDIDPRDEESIKRISKVLNKFPKCKRIYVDRDNPDESLSIPSLEAAESEEIK